MRKFVRFFLGLFGWKIDTAVPKDLDKAVVVMAPHTSNWDFVIGFLAFYLMRIPANFLIKRELFFFPLGWILRKMGGIPVDRKRRNNLIELSCAMFQDKKQLFLVFTPEGTRSANANWKKGFYVIAQTAKVPIVSAYIDYSTKTGGFHKVHTITDNFESDVHEIKVELSQFKGKYPEKGIIF